MHRTLTGRTPDSGLIGLLGLIVVLGLLVWNPLPALDARVAPASLASSTIVRIDPPEQVVDPGATFTIDIVVEDVSDLVGYEFAMAYDPAVLQFSEAENADFLGSTGRSIIPISPNVDNQAGVVRLAGASMGTQAGPDGAGTLTTVTLTGVGEGVTDLELYDVKLADSAAGRIAATVQKGRVKVGQGPMPTQAPTEVPAESPTPTEGPEVTGTPPDPEATATSAPGETPEGETPTPGAITPTEEAEAATATAAAGVPAEETAAAMTPSPAPDVATDTPDSTVDETAEPGEPQEPTAEAPEPLPTDADEALETDGDAGAGINWLLIAAAVLTVLGVAAVALGVLMFKAEDQPGQDAS